MFYLDKELDEQPTPTPTPEDSPANDQLSFSLQPLLIFVVLVAIVGFYISRRRSQTRQQGEKEFDA